MAYSDPSSSDHEGTSDYRRPLQKANVATISVNLSSVLILNGTNFKDWKENILIVLGCMDLDLALRTEQLTAPIDTSFSEQRAKNEKWDRSNRISLMIIKRGIPKAFRSAVSNSVTKTKEYLDEIEKRFSKSDKAETSTILKSLISIKYKGKGNVRKYIMEMSNLASKLKALNLELLDVMLVYLMLISLPNQFNQFQINYNCQREK
ncbi:uncharacterized protein LOC122044042 [Zingiber officinale]|uniref:uncharacterized protein LOC122044042 n=1 Tax=Zingiber officinale TaxID=94328 RepID=UPI001C4DAB8D|nr:uncharacterized protein LOC122044042 [Zingiber officinale]